MPLVNICNTFVNTDEVVYIEYREGRKDVHSKRDSENRIYIELKGNKGYLIIPVLNEESYYQIMDHVGEEIDRVNNVIRNKSNQ